MIHALLVLLVCQLAGEAASRAFSLPLPGPVLGMLLMLAVFLASKRAMELVRPVATFILAHLSLLFVPAGVGVVAYLAELRDHGLAIAVAIVVSTLAAMLVGALVFVAVARLTGNRP